MTTAHAPTKLDRLTDLVRDWDDLRRRERQRRTPEVLDIVEDLTLNTTEVGVTLPDGRRVETGVSFEMPLELWEDADTREQFAEWCRTVGINASDKREVTSALRLALHEGTDFPAFVLVRENVRVV